MSSYIDFDSLDDDVKELNQFIQDELGIQTYKETMLLLQRAKNTLQPAQKKAEDSDTDYLG